MKESAIELRIGLDNDRIPERILWRAEDGTSEGFAEAKSLTLALWDDHVKETVKIDLWTKDMPVFDMKRFYIETLGSMAESLLAATGDEFMAEEMRTLCGRLTQHIQNEGK